MILVLFFSLQFAFAKSQTYSQCKGADLTNNSSQIRFMFSAGKGEGAQKGVGGTISVCDEDNTAAVNMENNMLPFMMMATNLSYSMGLKSKLTEDKKLKRTWDYMLEAMRDHLNEKNDCSKSENKSTPACQESNPENKFKCKEGDAQKYREILSCLDANNYTRDSNPLPPDRLRNLLKQLVKMECENADIRTKKAGDKVVEDKGRNRFCGLFNEKRGGLLSHRKLTSNGKCLRWEVMPLQGVLEKPSYKEALKSAEGQCGTSSQQAENNPNARNVIQQSMKVDTAQDGVTGPAVR